MYTQKEKKNLHTNRTFQHLHTYKHLHIRVFLFFKFHFIYKNQHHFAEMLDKIEDKARGYLVLVEDQSISVIKKERFS